MNLDALNNNWLSSSYSLFTLSKMVKSTCNSSNFSQLVQEPTRHQFNSVTGKTSISCLDHIYTNYRFRCSVAKVIPFGNSDHNIVQYVRFSKEAPSPSRTIRKRSYKTFILTEFLAELQDLDFSSVYFCNDLDEAVSRFTNLMNQVLDNHAPWVTFQLRKKFNPWITDTTLALMKDRDRAKTEASKLNREGRDSSEAWGKYKQLRNKVNNRIKLEERNCKLEKIKESLDSPSKTWKTWAS